MYLLRSVASTRTIVVLGAVLIGLSLAPLIPADAQDAIWYRQFGTAGNDFVTGLASDGTNAYAVGEAGGSLTGQGTVAANLVFLRKLDPSGNAIWTREFNTGRIIHASGVALDGQGGIYIDGFESIDGPYLQKYDGNGALVWTRFINTPGCICGSPPVGVATDGANGIYLLGGPMTGAHGWLTKLDSDGNSVFVKTLGTDTSPAAIAAFGTQALYLTGDTFVALPGQMLAGQTDAFVRKYDSNGNEQWTREFGTAAVDRGIAVAVDSSGGIVVTGNTAGAFPGFGFAGGVSDAFVRKYDADGNEQWTRQFGNNSDDFTHAVAADLSGNSYVVGRTSLALGGAMPLGSFDAFVRKFDPSGNVVWTTLAGGPGAEEPFAAAADASNGLYIGGQSDGLPLPSQVAAGNHDAWVARLSTTSTSTATPTPTLSATATPQPSPTVVPGLGGRSFGISSDPAGVHLSWLGGGGGSNQTGYTLYRLAGGDLVSGTVGANETSYLDTTAPPGLDCYAVQPMVSPERHSDALCVRVGFHSLVNSPTNFTIRLNESNTASFTWSPPPGSPQDEYRLLNFDTGQIQSLDRTATSATMPLPAWSCFALGAFHGGELEGYTDMFCGLPGFTNL